MDAEASVGDEHVDMAEAPADFGKQLGRVPIKGFRFSQDDDSMSLEGD